MDMTQMSLNTAIFSFAFSGMLAPHRREPAPPQPVRPASAAPSKKK
jgi:hypothetical protein